MRLLEEGESTLAGRRQARKEGEDADKLGGAEEGPNVHSVVQFSTERYFCKEDEGHVSVDVIRFGDSATTASFKYVTEDGSASSSGPCPKYKAAAGEMFFEEGETFKTIHVQIVHSDQWEATADFIVTITQVRGAQMGQYLHRCRVSILDDDAFPTNRYRAQLFSQQAISEIPGFGLMFEYCKMNLYNAEILYNTLKIMVQDQLKNAYFLMTIYLQMYLIDEVLGGEGEGEERRLRDGDYAPPRLLLETIRVGGQLISGVVQLHEEGGEFEHEGGEGEAEEGGEALLVPGSRSHTAIAVGLLYIIPFSLMHALDAMKAASHLGGMVRLKLQANLLRKFLNFKEKIRDSISTGDLTMAMTRDIPEVVEAGFMKLVALCYFLGKVSCVLIFILSENKMAAVPLAVFPVIGAIFLCTRERKMVEANEDMARKQNDLAHTVQNVIANYRLIADFSLRSHIVNNYEGVISNYNSCARESAMIMTNNVYLPPWLTTLLVGGYMMFGTFQVQRKIISLGAFVATINVFKELGVELTELYMMMMEIQKATGPLRTLCYFMNLPTDLEDRMRINRERRRKGKAKREAARQNHYINGDNEKGGGKNGVMLTDQGVPVFAVDTLNIELEGVSFGYDSAVPLLRRVSAAFPQGKLYAFIGPEHNGKATMIKIMAQVLIPEQGDVFVPPHMRVLHVASTPYFLNESILRNIIFNQDLKKGGGYARVRRICERCGFNSTMLTLLDDAKNDEDEGKEIEISMRAAWASTFTSTDFARLNLARALVMNPNTLLLHMPFISFSDAAARSMIELLREHIDERGIELPVHGRKFRRPRTIFLTSSSLDRCLHAHVIYEVSKEHGIRQVPHVR